MLSLPRKWKALADLVHQRGLFEAFLKVATIKKTPVLKREELYQGLIEPGWGAGLLNPAQRGERNILYIAVPTRLLCNFRIS
jgi:hypothetical protein